MDDFCKLLLCFKIAVLHYIYVTWTKADFLSTQRKCIWKHYLSKIPFYSGLKLLIIHGCHGVSNHQLLECLFKSLFRLTINTHQSSTSLALKAFVRGIHWSLMDYAKIISRAVKLPWYFQELYWLSMGLPQISKVTMTGMHFHVTMLWIFHWPCECHSVRLHHPHPVLPAEGHVPHVDVAGGHDRPTRCTMFKTRKEIWRVPQASHFWTPQGLPDARGGHFTPKRVGVRGLRGEFSPQPEYPQGEF